MFGLVERAKNLAKQALNYVSSVVGSDDQARPANNSDKKKNINVMNPAGKTVAKPEDEFVKQDNKNVNKTTKNEANKPSGTKNKKTDKPTVNQPQTKKITGEDVFKKMVEIDSLIKKYDISEDEFNTVILPELGYSKKEFDKLSSAKKMTVLNTISGATKLYIVDKNKNNTKLDKAELLANAAADLQKATQEGGIKNAQEFDKETRFYIHKLHKELKTAGCDEEKINIIQNNRQELENNIKAQRDAELKKCKTDEERALVNKKYDSRIEAFEGYLQSGILASDGKPENAYMSTYMRRGKDMAKGTERAITAFSCEMRACAADSFTHERRVKQLENYANRGDSISADVYGESIQIQTSYMSKEGLKIFEKDAYEFKKEFYKNKSKYSFITEEHLTKESVATAMGAALNNNLSASEKAEFLKIWEEHAQQFSDYESVKNGFEAALKQYLEKHPEAKQGIEDVKTKLQEKYRKIPSAHKAEVKIPVQKQQNSKKQVLNKNSSKKTENQVKANAQQLERALLTSPYEKVREQYSQNSERDFAEVVLHNPKLKGHKQNIVSYIKRLSPKDLSNITRGCSTEMFLFVLRNISPDKAGRLYDLSKSDKCYASRKLGEKIIEEGRENAAA